MTRRRLLARTRHGDEGFALLVVLGTMVVVTLFLLTTLAYALQNTPPSRADQDSKAAVAAAQAGIEEFVARLNADDTYYANDGVDPSNAAFGAGVRIPGTGSDAASFSYRLLTTAVETGITGAIRLQVTGQSRGVRRTLTATLKPDGFLKYVYFTDLEVADPVLYRSGRWVAHRGALPEGPGLPPMRRVDNTPTRWTEFRWQATPAMVDAVCSEYYYTVRHARTYTTGQYVEYAQDYRLIAGSAYKDGPERTALKSANATDTITLDCLEVQFGPNDVVDGPLHSNDALQITGAATFTQRTTSSWGANTATSTLASPKPVPSDGKLWWAFDNNKTTTLPAQSPQTSRLVQLPSSNELLRRKANPLSPDLGPGCLYTGQTSIHFVDDHMEVLSPGTTSSVARCYNTAPGQRNQKQTVKVPPVIYVQGGACGTVGVGYPKVDEATGASRLTTKYDCSFGTAFVSGVLKGRVTIGTARDVVIVGDTTYKDGMTGSDALGLIPQGSAWVYRPLTANDQNVSSYVPVRRIDAAILSVAHSFLVQNYQRGAPVTTDEASKLHVRGAILQKFRGPVGKGAPLEHGYLKNYTYDARLHNAPPPFFLRPLSSPWKVVKVEA